MAITKSIKFAAPFRSSTFNEATSQLVGMNGVVSGGAVSTSGAVVTIQPLTFIQNGLFVTSDAPLTATLSGTLQAPYSVAVSTSSSVENLLETITPTFISRPQEVTSSTVIVADWDGYEWIPRPKVQISELIQAEKDRAVANQFVGICDGFDVTYSSGTITVEGGSLIDQQGSVYTKTLASTFSAASADADGLERVDEIVYRRPDDSSVRSGSVKYVTGRAFNSSGTVQVLHSTQYGDTGSINQANKILIDPATNKSLFIYTEDYGDRAKIRLVTAPDLMSSNTAAVTLATGISGFDAILNSSGNIEVVYTKGKKVYFASFTQAGASVISETEIASHAVTTSHPKLVSVKNLSSYYIHVVYELENSSLVHDLYYVRLSPTAAILTAALPIVSLSAVLTNPSLDKDDEDKLFFLAFENSTTGRVYLRTYDASTAAALSIPSQYGTPVELQDDSYILSSATTAPTTGASHPVVKRADNKDTFVFWRQDKGSSVYGIAVYHKGIFDTYDHKALIIDLSGAGENVAKFDVTLDGLNGAHFIASIGTNTIKASYNLKDYTAIGSAGTLESIAPATLATTFNAKGSLVHSWSAQSVGTTNNGNVSAVQLIGPGNLGTTAIGANEFVILKSTGSPFTPGWDDLTKTPTLGDTVTLSSAGANNGTYDVLSSRTFTQSMVTYVAVATSGTFTATPSGPAAQFKYLSGTNIKFAKTTAGAFTNLRGFDVLRTDVFLAHYRSSDNVLAVSGPTLEESTTLTRLYEFINCFGGGGGSVSWQIVGTNKLSFTAGITLRFFNRNATYTVAAIPAGITITANQVAYVQIPDTDSDATLTLSVADFGSGILDRGRRNTYPLFWNIGSALYTRFAPFRLDTGETVILGDQMSSQMLSWLGASDSTPDFTNHAYSSIVGASLLQSDSINTAVGKLDNQINTNNLLLARFQTGTVSIPTGVTTVSGTYATARASTNYSLIVSVTNTTDASPIFMPVVVTSKTTTGFTAQWNTATDTANYKLEYILRDS